MSWEAVFDGLVIFKENTPLGVIDDFKGFIEDSGLSYTFESRSGCYRISFSELQWFSHIDPHDFFNGIREFEDHILAADVDIYDLSQPAFSLRLGRKKEEE